MRRLLLLPTSLTLLTTLTFALPHITKNNDNNNDIPLPPLSPLSSPAIESNALPLPLLIWHGLGDRFDAEGLRSVGALAEKIYPGTYVYYIHTAADGSQDRTNTFLGNISQQIDDVCLALRNDSRLVDASRQYIPSSSSSSFYSAVAGDEEEGKYPTLRVDAMGFSQGGQFLRGLLERCAGLHVRSLVTFGSQHNGIAKFQDCGTWDLVCKAATALVRGNVWTDTVQGSVVPAQYFRATNGSYPPSISTSSTTTLEEQEEDNNKTRKKEPEGKPDDAYLEYSHFLADINNERPHPNKKYQNRLSRLSHFVMYVFEDDKTVIPKESGWFADVNVTSGFITPLRERKLYREDWLGLKTLDDRGALEFRSMKGAHMDLDAEVLKATFAEFFGPEKHVDDEEKISSNVHHEMQQQQFNTQQQIPITTEMMDETLTSKHPVECGRSHHRFFSWISSKFRPTSYYSTSIVPVVVATSDASGKN